MDWKKILLAIRNGVVDFFSDDEDLPPDLPEEEIEISLKGLAIFICLIIILGLAAWGVRSLVIEPETAYNHHPVYHTPAPLMPPPTQPPRPTEVHPPTSTPSPVPTEPYPPEKILSLPVLRRLDIGAANDAPYLADASFRTGETYPPYEGDGTHRWSYPEARVFFPFPREDFTGLDVVLAMPPGGRAGMMAIINGMQYPAHEVREFPRHYLFSLIPEQLAAGYLDVRFSFTGMEGESGVQFLNLGLLTSEETARLSESTDVKVEHITRG